MRQIVPIILLATACAAGTGFLLGRFTQPEEAIAMQETDRSPQFHNIRINPTDDYVRLIDPDHPEIARLAGTFSSYEEAYRFVSADIRFAPQVPPGPVNKTLEYRTGSCLGKAALLGSLYRAMGMRADEVRIIMGIVITPAGPADHVWLDLEHQGMCLQQDPSGLLGSFEFNEFPGERYTDTYVMKESFCFNDSDFAVVSQLNRFRDN